MRKNNIEDMTITEQLQKIFDDICTNYCKWPEKWDEEAEGCELSESEHCDNCPLMKL